MRGWVGGWGMLMVEGWLWWRREMSIVEIKVDDRIFFRVRIIRLGNGVIRANEIFLASGS